MRLKLFLIASSVAMFSFVASAESLSDKYHVSFSYDGQAFNPQKWSASETKSGNGDTKLVYTSPDSRLKLSVTYKRYEGYPIVEMRPVLECVGDTETGIVDDFKTLDLSLPCNSNSIKVRRITGSKTAPTDFCHQDVLLQRRHECDRTSMSSVIGRSLEWIPYFGVDFGSLSGLEFALGWTGTWKADFHYGDNFELKVGLGEKTHFKMLPGESFQMPYIVVYEREGESVEEMHVRFHRFVIDNKSPRDSNGKLIEPLIPLTSSGGNKTDENMLKILNKATETFKVPFNAFWVDAGWSGKYHEIAQNVNCGKIWKQWVGYWYCNPFSHPDGNMKKISDAAHAKGLKFLLWFEPERATANTPVVQEHPEYFNCAKGDQSGIYYLLDLGNKEAFNWIFGELSRCIEENGIDVFRQDFNMNPMQVWLDADESDRMGTHEIRHINGLWALWDALRHKYPDLLFENCAGGGTRMDIEMMSRSHSYCRDDAHMSPGCEEMVQNITLNTTQYIPFTGGETFAVKPLDSYGFLSCLGAGIVFTPTDFDGMLLTRDPSKEEVEWFTKMLNAANRCRPLFFGDFYALTKDYMDASDIYCAYQLNRADTGEGFFLVFRRKECREDTFNLSLRGIDPKAVYEVETFDGKTVTMKGSALARQALHFNNPREFRLVFYKKR